MGGKISEIYLAQDGYQYLLRLQTNIPFPIYWIPDVLISSICYTHPMRLTHIKFGLFPVHNDEQYPHTNKK